MHSIDFKCDIAIRKRKKNGVAVDLQKAARYGTRAAENALNDKKFQDFKNWILEGNKDLIRKGRDENLWNKRIWK